MRRPAGRGPLTRLLPLLCGLALIATACGGGGTSVVGGHITPTPTLTATPTVTPTPTPSPADLVRLNDAGAIQQNGLRIDLIGSVGALNDGGAVPYPTFGMSCNPVMVLNPPPTGGIAPFGASDIAAIQAYLDTVSLTPAGLPMPDANTPNALRWVAGGAGNACFGEMLIKNIGQKAVQIASVGLQLTAATVANQYTYALVDVCTAAGNPDRYAMMCSPGSSRGGQCGNYAEIHLAMGGTGAMYSGPVSNLDPTCPGALIQPGDTQAIALNIINDNGGAAVFQVAPVLTVADVATGTTSTLVLSALPATLVFSTPSQFQCYGLTNGSLRQIPYDGGPNGGSLGHFCI